MNVYVVVGTIENVYQEIIGGPFEAHPKKEIVRIFKDESAAENFVKNSQLKCPRKHSYGDTSYYKGGYYELEVETHEVEG